VTMTISEYDKIVATVRLYVDGFNDHDTKKFKEAFHEDAQMFYIDENGALHVHRLDDEILRNGRPRTANDISSSESFPWRRWARQLQWLLAGTTIISTFMRWSVPTGCGR
jgi:hypothetical protein